MIQPVSETRLPDASTERSPGPVLLGDFRVIDVDGDDASSFLQGQFCNDVAALSAGQAQINGYCTPKGRLLATFVLHRRDSGFRLLLPDPAVAAAFAKRLGMFIMRAAVTLQPREDLAVLGLFGEQAPGHGLPEWPGAPLRATEAGTATLLRWHDDPVEGPRALGVVAQAAAHGLEAGDAAWRLGDIRAGLPSVRAATMEAFVPQMLNFREIDAVSFKKGCYPGQEIVARMHYLGKQKRHMRRFVAQGDIVEQVVPGQTLGEAGLAEVVDAVRTASGIELLAVVRVGAAEQGLPLDASAGEPSVAAHDAELPYPLEQGAPDGATGASGTATAEAPGAGA